MALGIAFVGLGALLVMLGRRQEPGLLRLIWLMVSVAILFVGLLLLVGAAFGS